MKTKTELLAALAATGTRKNTVAYRRVKLAIESNKEGFFDGVHSTADGKTRINVVCSSGRGRFTTYVDHEFEIKNLLRALEIPFETGNFSTSGRGAYGKCVYISTIQ